MLKTSPRVRTYENLPGVNAPGIPAVAPLPTGETADTTRIVERFGADILAAGCTTAQQVVYVKPERLVELAEFVQAAIPQLRYEALTDVTAVDRLELPIDGDGEPASRPSTNCAPIPASST
jgi:hypothetical protein